MLIAPKIANCPVDERLIRVYFTNQLTKIIPLNLSTQAYEEKEKLWEKELRKIKGLYDNRLRASQQKSSKMEQALTNQTYQVSENLVIDIQIQFTFFVKCNLFQLQSDKRRLERDLEDIRKMHDSKNTENSNLQKELIGLRYVRYF